MRVLSSFQADFVGISIERSRRREVEDGFDWKRDMLDTLTRAARALVLSLVVTGDRFKGL